MTETPRVRLYLIMEAYRSGVLGVDAFCAQFEQTYNLELDKSTLSQKETQTFQKLFEEVVWYSPFPEERAAIPNYRDDVDVKQAVERAAKELQDERPSY